MSLGAFGDEGSVGNPPPDDCHRCPVCGDLCGCANGHDGGEPECECIASHPDTCASGEHAYGTSDWCVRCGTCADGAHEYGTLGYCVRCGRDEPAKARG